MHNHIGKAIPGHIMCIILHGKLLLDTYVHTDIGEAIPGHKHVVIIIIQ